MSDSTATLDREHPERFIVFESLTGWQALKDDLLPLMALLGTAYGWVLALLVALIAAVARVVS